ncbi:uncharacterized PurR-regulated membrane protein YhhQ (DUF165 family) [Microbacterium foliorum]|uniref:Uncharacterized PurR-regulated membrane protein YhhQ (DUF165 family) n=1 Tax=Microbacterium foliorum TaxID=104336 RepID=A0ABU1HUT6_9MICO|nr:hypothetical protein [Microbacterium foliorum]MDR6143815.1 uncharacterized PurR-regulated membrane protein YhhQ (DUF165 family) [Microbacterium foliorum]
MDPVEHRDFFAVLFASFASVLVGAMPTHTHRHAEESVQGVLDLRPRAVIASTSAAVQADVAHWERETNH